MTSRPQVTNGNRLKAESKEFEHCKFQQQNSPLYTTALALSSQGPQLANPLRFAASNLDVSSYLSKLPPSLLQILMERGRDNISTSHSLYTDSKENLMAKRERSMISSPITSQSNDTVCVNNQNEHDDTDEIS